MSIELAEEQLIRSYFLGDLPESEQERIQERLFTDRIFFENLLIIEGELVDDYVLGLISDPDRIKLENGFLTSPHQYRKVRFVEALDRYISEKETTSPPRIESASESLFSRLFSRFIRSDSRPVVQNRVSDVQKRESDLWEQLLREAQTNRALILSLMEDYWLGLEILLELNSVPQMAATTLFSMVQRDNASVSTAISRLIECGLVEETSGEYSCSWFGAETLAKLKKLTGLL